MFFRKLTLFPVFFLSFLFYIQSFAENVENNDEFPIGEDIPRLKASHDLPELFKKEFFNRTSFFIGHNLSNRLEGLFYSDGSVKNVGTNTAFSMGIKGRVIDFPENIRLAMEIEYNTSRSLNPTAFAEGENGSSRIFSPRLSFFSMVSLMEFKISQDMDSFVGLNFNFPITSNSPFKLVGDLGFQIGASHNVYKHIWLEGLIKVNNMDLYNNRGEKRDVSLAGLELRGRYSF